MVGSKLVGLQPTKTHAELDSVVDESNSKSNILRVSPVKEI